MFVAKNFFLSSGIGVDKNELGSFDRALCSAGLGDYNLIKVSSIIPPNAVESNCINCPQGSAVYVAFAKKMTTTENVISSAVAVGLSNNSHDIGVIMEYSCFGNKKRAVSIAKELAEGALTRRGIYDYTIISKGVEAKGKKGLKTTTFASVALF